MLQAGYSFRFDCSRNVAQRVSLENEHTTSAIPHIYIYWYKDTIHVQMFF